jgi:DNA-directed RNA polymerase sigma subunit (sigma70/sigma32)
MSTFLWPSEDGWPYPDADVEQEDPEAWVDDDALLLKAAPMHLFESLDPIERRIVTAHYGLDGNAPRSVKELHTELGMSRAEVRTALVSGLEKLRLNLSA